MKAVISISNLVIPVENLKDFDLLLAGAIEMQAYDYNNGECAYYVRPCNNDPLSIKLLTEDTYEAQKLIWKLKEEAK